MTRPDSKDKESPKKLNFFLYFQVSENCAELDINRFPFEGILDVNMKP